MSTYEEIFTEVYHKNSWGYSGQKFPLCSGVGLSDPTFRKFLQTYIAKNNIKTVVDIGCGVWDIERDEFDCLDRYIGIDCVREVIELNNQHWAKGNRTFIYADALDDNYDLPDAELCIIKDVLQHFDNDSVLKLLLNVQMKYRFTIVINDDWLDYCDNDIKIGEWRSLHYSKFPLNIFSSNEIDHYGNKSIVLMEQIPNTFVTRLMRDVPKDRPLPDKKVLIAILARNKQHVLPDFLQTIYDLEYNKKLITVYINTNNNSDCTEQILKDWTNAHIQEYAHIDLDIHDAADLKNMTDDPHAWCGTRFKVLGAIRNKSMAKTKEYNCDYYFVVDCDNFIRPYTLADLVYEDKPIIAPLLKAVPEPGDKYRNFFAAIDDNGYYGNSDKYYEILDYILMGTINVPVVHCTYLINSKCLDQLTYTDGSNDYEFVIFSKSARNNSIDQYICNKYDFGVLLHSYNDAISLTDESAKYLQWKTESRYFSKRLQ